MYMALRHTCPTLQLNCHTCLPYPQVEYRDLNIQTEALVGSAAVPTVGSSFINLARVSLSLSVPERVNEKNGECIPCGACIAKERGDPSHMH